MRTPYKVLRADGSEESFEVNWPRDPSGDQINSVVRPNIPSLSADGVYSYDEHVYVVQGGDRVDMFVDENGEAKRLPRNEAATVIYRASWMMAHPGTDPESLRFIRGDAVLFLRRIWW